MQDRSRRHGRQLEPLLHGDRDLERGQQGHEPRAERDRELVQGARAQPRLEPCGLLDRDLVDGDPRPQDAARAVDRDVLDRAEDAQGTLRSRVRPAAVPRRAAERPGCRGTAPRRPSGGRGSARRPSRRAAAPRSGRARACRRSRRSRRRGPRPAHRARVPPRAVAGPPPRGRARSGVARARARARHGPRNPGPRPAPPASRSRAAGIDSRRHP